MYEKYLAKYNITKSLIKAEPEQDLFNIIVIPCLNEPEILNTLQSLKFCDLPKKTGEVIIVINSSELAEANVVEQNKLTFDEINNFAKKENNQKIKFHTILIKDVPKKKAGAGFARKLGMDEAIFRFNKIGVDGVITNLDADTIVDKNYLTEIENTFLNTKTNAASIYFEHDLDEQKFGKDVILGIKKYELYLRYFKQALRYINFPFATHTIGSAFAVKVSIYVSYGGMKATQAGEDFYFIQKVIQAGNYAEITKTKVVPSPRLSQRVIFGTGPAIIDILKEKDFNYYVYSIESFKDLKLFIDKINLFFNVNNDEINNLLNSLPKAIVSFLTDIKFEETIIKIKANTKTQETFRKAFFNNFNTFSLIRFLNETHQQFYKKQEVEVVAKLLLDLTNREYTNTNLDSLLNIFKQIDLENC